MCLLPHTLQPGRAPSTPLRTKLVMQAAPCLASEAMLLACVLLHDIPLLVYL